MQRRQLEPSGILVKLNFLDRADRTPQRGNLFMGASVARKSLAADLVYLSIMYRVDFPLPEGARGAGLVGGLVAGAVSSRANPLASSLPRFG
jgi:hypothetical protein